MKEVNHAEKLKISTML